MSRTAEAFIARNPLDFPDTAMNILPRLIRGCWWLFVACLVVLAIYVVAGRYFASSLSSYQLQIEDYLHDMGFKHVEIGRIEGGWHHFDPQLYVTDFRLGQSSAAILELDQLSVRLNAFRSILSRKPILRDLEVSGIRFTLDRDAEGRIKIRGIARDGGAFDWQYLLDSLPHLGRFRLSDIDISVLGLGTPLHIRSDDDPLRILSNGDAGKVVSLPLYLDRTLSDGRLDRRRIWLAGTYRGDPRDSDFNADLYLDIPSLEIGDFLSGHALLRLDNRHLSTAKLSAKAWIGVRQGNVDITSRLALRDVRLGGEGGEIALLDVAETEFKMTGRLVESSLSEGSIFAPSLLLKSGTSELVLNNLQLALGRDETGIKLAARLPWLDLAGLMPLLDNLTASFVPDRVSAGLKKVNLRGALAELLFISGMDIDSSRLVASLDGVMMDAQAGLPAVDRVDGLLSLTREQGYIDINNDQFTMHFTNMFAQPWHFTSARGRIRYQNNAGQLLIDSGLLEVISQEQIAHGKVLFKLPQEKEEQTWGMIIGVRNARLLDAKRYIPRRLPPALATWLDTGIRGGTSVESGLLFHGALFRASPVVRKAYDLFFKVNDTRLSYHQDWPEIEDIEATVHVSNYAVTSKDAVGRVYDSKITSAEVLVPIDARTRRVDRLVLDATASGPAADAIRLLNETPLSETLHQMANSWSADGEATATLHLKIPIGSQAGEKVYSDIQVAFQNTQLVMPEFDLNFSQLAGTTSYNNAQGFNSRGFTGMLFGEPVEGKIRSRFYGDGGEVTVNLKGAVNARDLYHWSDQILLSRVEGKTDYVVSLYVPYGGKEDETYIEASSDLTGVTIDLPPPFGKLNPDIAREFTYRQNFLASGHQLELQLGAQVQASLRIDEGIVTGGLVHLGKGPLGAPVYDAVRVTGGLPFLDYKDWSDLIDELGEISDLSLTTTLARQIDSIRLNMDRLTLFALELEDVATTVTRQEGQWVANISHDSLSGLVRLSDQADDPISISLEFLKLGEEEGKQGSETEDLLADFNLQEVVAVDFSTKKLILNGKDYGAWSFNYRVADDTVQLNNFSVSMKGLQVLDTSSLTWRSGDGAAQTHFQGDIQLDDLAEVLPVFGLASSIESKGLKMSADLVWPGSPAMLDINQIQGTVKIHEGEGRFVQANIGGSLKLLGIFDFAQLFRRFQLDFSDIAGEGFEFSDINGEMAFDQGVIEVMKPLTIHGSVGIFKIGGNLNLHTQALDNDMIVTLPVSRNLPWYAAYSAVVAGPLTGIGIIIARNLFRKKIDQFSSAKYKISGTIDEPDIEFVGIFDDTVRKPSSAPETE